MLTNKSIVVYNKFTNPKTRLTDYQPIIIPEVFYTGAKAVNVNRSGLDSADAITILIPKYVLDNLEKEYVDPIKFSRLRDKDRHKYFTLAPGDRIIVGSIIYDVKDLDKEVEAFTLTKADEKFFGSYRLQHMRIGAL